MVVLSTTARKSTHLCWNLEQPVRKFLPISKTEPVRNFPYIYAQTNASVVVHITMNFCGCRAQTETADFIIAAFKDLPVNCIEFDKTGDLRNRKLASSLIKWQSSFKYIIFNFNLKKNFRSQNCRACWLVKSNFFESLTESMLSIWKKNIWKLFK